MPLPLAVMVVTVGWRAIKVALFFAVAAVVGALVGYARQRARHRYEESLLAAASGGGEKA